MDAKHSTSISRREWWLNHYRYLLVVNSGKLPLYILLLKNQERLSYENNLSFRNDKYNFITCCLR